MTLEEYTAVKDLNYDEYCEYLRMKYGPAKEDYFFHNYMRNPKVSRTKEGLFAHHVKEDRAILLSTHEIAKKHPWEYQAKENIVYCDWLEHLYAHILIVENPAPDAEEGVGIGGCVSYLVPQLNDIFAGYRSVAKWEQNCIDRITEEDRDSNYSCYIRLVARLKADLAKILAESSPDDLMGRCNYHLCTVSNEEYWEENRDRYLPLFQTISALPVTCSEQVLEPEVLMRE